MSQSSLKERGNWWVTQAQNDYDWAKNTLDGKFYAQALYFAANSRKSLKGVILFTRKRASENAFSSQISKGLEN